MKFRALASASCLIVMGSSASAAVLFSEDFLTDPPGGADQPITTVGWLNDIANSNDARIFDKFSDGTDNAVWSWNGSTSTEAFYTTTEDGAGWTSFDLSSVVDLTFSIDNQSSFNGSSTAGHFALQLNGTDWFVAASPVGEPTETWTTHQMPFDPSASAWNELTVSGTGATDSGASIGGSASSDLTGSVTGVGFVVTRTESATQNFDNFEVAAIPEPSVWLLGSLALLGFSARRRR